jgi:hypothetical protein
MATEDLKASAITNRDAVPSVKNDVIVEGGVIRECIGAVTTTSGVTVGSTYRMVQVPSSARVTSVIIAAGAMTQGPFDVGVYKSVPSGGTVVDADFFASAVDCSSAVALTEILTESTVNTIAKQAQPLWEALGLSADPQIMYDIVCTSTNTITAGAALLLKVKYTVN